MKISSHLLLYCALYPGFYPSNHFSHSTMLTTCPTQTTANWSGQPEQIRYPKTTRTAQLCSILRRGRLSSASDSLANLGWKPLHEYHHLNWIKLAKPSTRVHIIHSLSIFTFNVTCSHHYTRGKSSNRLILLRIEQNMVKDCQALS